jgi:peptide/nickel transport system permease protein
MAEATPILAPTTPVPPRAGATRTNENVRRSIRRFRRNPLSMIGLTILLFLVVIALLAPQIVPYPEDATGNMRAAARLEPPSAEFYFGTDNVGRDIFSRVLMGTGLALRVGIVIIVLASAIGVTVGALAGYFGGWIDDLLMRLTDIFLTVPALVLAIAVTAALGKGIFNVMIGISLVWWPGFARLTRSLVLSLREEVYVEAARSTGVRESNILVRHILPNILSPIIVKMSTDFGFAVLTAAALGFIGLGAQPPTPEWGAMINDGRDYFPDDWWVSTFPGMAIFLMVFSWNLLGDGIRDLLDPRGN